MNITRTVSTFFLVTMLISNVAMAEGKKLADKLSNVVIETVAIEVPACDADAAILCPGLPQGSQKSFMCLMAYEDNLSVACQLGIVEAAMALEMGMMALEYSIKACEADADKYCLDVEAGEGRIVSCLRKNEAKLNKACTAALKESGLWDLGAK
jgi:hypothetical protein